MPNVKIDRLVLLEIVCQLGRFKDLAQAAAGGHSLEGVCVCWLCGRGAPGARPVAGCECCAGFFEHPDIVGMTAMAEAAVADGDTIAVEDHSRTAAVVATAMRRC